METPESPGGTGFQFFHASHFPEAMEQRMNKDDVRVETIDSRRQNQVTANAVDPAIPSAAKRIQEKPREELQELRPGNRRNLVPDNRASSAASGGTIKRKIFNALRIEMDFTLLVARKPL